MSKPRFILGIGIAAMITAITVPVEAGWGRYRVTTYYGTPSVPVVRETVVVRSAYRPVVAPAPIVVAPSPVTAYYAAPVTTYYGSPSLYVGPRGVVRAAYYAPAPGPYFAPAPATYYQGYYAPGTVILP